jgi:hypothetical protein
MKVGDMVATACGTRWAGPQYYRYPAVEILSGETLTNVNQNNILYSRIPYSRYKL